MDQDPVLGAVVTADLEQFVDAMFAGLGVANDFLQFLIEWDGIVGPIDAGMDGGKAETQEGLEVTVERQLPGTVVIVAVRDVKPLTWPRADLHFPPESIWMSASPRGQDKTQRQVTISHGIWMGKNEVAPSAVALNRRDPLLSLR